MGRHLVLETNSAIDEFHRVRIADSRLTTLDRHRRHSERFIIDVVRPNRYALLEEVLLLNGLHYQFVMHLQRNSSSNQVATETIHLLLVDMNGLDLLQAFLDRCK